MPDLTTERAKEILGPLLVGAEKEMSFETPIKGSTPILGILSDRCFARGLMAISPSVPSPMSR